MKQAACAFVAVLALAVSLPAQTLSSPDEYYIRRILQSAYETVQQHYYDPLLRGLDWDARYRDYSEKLKSAASVGAGLTVVAAFLDGLNDSHTFLQPPPQSYQVDYGYLIDLVGEDAFITHVRPGTDAAAKLTPGERVTTISGYDIDRRGFHTAQYILNILAPRSVTELTVADAGGATRRVTITSTIHQKRITRVLTNGNEISDVQRQQQEDSRWMRSRHVESGAVMIWKLPVFFAEDGEVDGLFNVANKQAALILDLRGNPGGRVDTLARALGHLFDHDVLIATRKARADSKAIAAAGRARGAFRGKLIVLIDSGSASAAELFARVVQLEQRGIVIGDRSAGAVMEARGYPFEMGNDNVRFYALSVTDADLIMKDGTSLEHAGVTPDEIVWPSPQDLASGRDPVLARAAELAGLKLDPAGAGKLFPFEWR